MKHIVFVDVDTQFDFMNPRGRLYVRGAEKIIPRLKALTRFADGQEIPIVSTMDTHAKNDPEFREFGSHCVRGSRGARKIPETRAATTRQIFVRKHTIDVFSNPDLKRVLRAYGTAYVYGVATDYCVKTAAVGLLKLGVKTYVVRDAVKAISRTEGSKALILLAERGVRFITARALMQRLSRHGKKG
jgi:nicotinamidase/pyrazinamidase